jgi:hypothetical protein
MYKIETTEYGLKLIFQGFISKEELKRCHLEIAKIVPMLKKGFSVLHDMRGMQTLRPDARELQKRSMVNAKKAGHGRAAQIVNNTIAAIQFKRLAKEAGVSDTSRQIDASSVSDCEKVAIDWLVKGIDPDK